MAQNPNYGGKRTGAGRKATIDGKTIAKTFRLSEQAAELLEGVRDKSAFIDKLIKDHFQQASQ